MDQIGANALKRTTKYDSNMQADTVSMAIKKLPSKNTCIIFNVNSQNLNAKSAQYKRSE